MSLELIVTVLLIVGLILSGIALAQSEAKSILCWAVFIIALALVIARVL